MNVRKTSTYTVEVQAGDADRACDEMKARCTAQLAASGVEGSRAFIRFRASSDDVARLVALKVWSGPVQMYTGFGVGRREVPPAA